MIRSYYAPVRLVFLKYVRIYRLKTEKVFIHSEFLRKISDVIESRFSLLGRTNIS